MDPKLEKKRVEILQSLLELIDRQKSLTKIRVETHKRLDDVFSFKAFHKNYNVNNIIEIDKKVTERLMLRYKRVLICDDINRLQYKDNSLAGGYLSF